MNDDNKVLACVDRSHFADYVADYAAWAAKRLQAPLEFLYVIERHPEIGSGNDHSGAIGIDATENLLQKLAQEDEDQARQAREQGRIFLNRLKEQALERGAVTVDVRQRAGELLDTVVEQQQAVQLIVLGRRGEGAELSDRDVGCNVERVLRALGRPVLTVTEKFSEPKRVMIAFDGGTAARQAVAMVAGGTLCQGLPIHLLMSGTPGQDGPRQLEAARLTLEAAGYQVDCALVPGEPERVIADAICEQRIDLLIMGAFSHSPLRSLLARSTTSELLRSVKIPTLLLR
jgi:nucleotide-binding universal stress UspA family protein